MVSLRLKINQFKIFPLFTLFLLQACTSAGLYQPLPQNKESKAQVIGFPKVRAWSNTFSRDMYNSAQLSYQQTLEANQGKMPSVNVLALSGGGADGAFGAGFLCGWSKSESRPKFQLVTGISTGALIAPFAFLGPKYDKNLREVYTNLSDDNLYHINNPLSVLLTYIRPVLRPSVASNKPLKQVIKKMATQAMLDEIAHEHLKGRRLLIGTTQLNAQRLVIWDIGAIANSHNPNALALFHKILLASSALPGIFPPQYFQVKSQGHRYKELHVDGGIENQVMLFEKAIVPFAKVYSANANQHSKLYIIRNSKVSPEWENVKPRLHYILGRVIFTLTKNQGVSDLYRLYAHALRDHLDYNLTYIPKNFNEHAKTPFDNQYMKKLFFKGYHLGKNNFKWKKYPPGFSGGHRKSMAYL